MNEMEKGFVLIDVNNDNSIDYKYIDYDYDYVSRSRDLPPCPGWRALMPEKKPEYESWALKFVKLL